MESVWAEETLQREEGCDVLLLRRTNVGKKIELCHATAFFFFLSFFSRISDQECAVGRDWLMNRLLFFPQ